MNIIIWSLSSTSTSQTTTRTASKSLISESSIKSMSFVRRPLLQFQLARRLFSSNLRLQAAPSFGSGPVPPRLPKEDQELYERLQHASTGAFSTPRPDVVVNEPLASPSASHQRQRQQINQSPHSEAGQEASTEQKLENINVKVEARGHGEELHPDVRRGAKPEFEGDKNPKTGEIGGPKNEPLRWGGGVDWSYNGRVTDF